MTIQQDLTLIILAAGLGSRFGVTQPAEKVKQLTPIVGLNRTIMELSIFDAVKAGVTKLVLVINQQIKVQVEADILPRLPPKLMVALAIQDTNDVPVEFKHLAKNRQKPWGTGHALLAAKPFVSGKAIVITADDYYGASAYQLMVKALQGDHWCLLGYPIVETLSAEGGVNRGICQIDQQSHLTRVVEWLAIQYQGGQLTGLNKNQQREAIATDSLVSMTIWGFDRRLFDYLARGFVEFLSSNDSVVEKEYYLPDQIQQAIDTEQLKVKVLVADDRWLGMTYRSELADVTKQLNAVFRENKSLFRE